MYLDVVDFLVLFFYTIFLFSCCLVAASATATCIASALTLEYFHYFVEDFIHISLGHSRKAEYTVSKGKSD